MLQFTSHLKKEIDTKIEQIECSEVGIITKSLDDPHMLTNAVNQLKMFVLSYNATVTQQWKDNLFHQKW
jgi:hypothetical protein